MSCNRISTEEECEEAAQSLGLSDTTATANHWSGPSHCVFDHDEDPGLWFNTNFLSVEIQCTSDVQCICRSGKSVAEFIVSCLSN